MSQLQQMQINYDQLQDRLTLTLFTQDWCEYRFWITRRAAKALISILDQLMKSNKMNETVKDQEKQEIVQKIEQEKAQRQPMAEKYSSRITRKPMGEEPVLINKIMAKPGEKGTFFIHLEDNAGHSIEFGGDTKIITALNQLLQRAIKQAEWNVDFQE
ncbi:MAG: hypothetical protein H0W88_04515 [Parachlamydiaceae bacterium]|nr:hypothetical protein [Parachlamydiaceae bacterium]